MTYSVPMERCGLDGTPLAELPSDPLIGFGFDKYRILDRLGEGAMGCVYLAQHVVLEDSRFAVKVLFGERAANREVARRFLNEGRHASKMRHPNVVAVTDIGKTPAGVTYLVMEYVEGDTLESQLQHAPFSFERTANLTRQIASGLAHAHARDIVHRDLKPANIILSAQPEGEIAKLTDFGLARDLEQGVHATKLTQDGNTLGTPLYMPPEQFQGSTVGPGADLYALGVMMYEMLTGTPPYDGGVLALTLKKSRGVQKPLPECGGLGPLAMQLLEVDPQRRPPNALAVVSAIDALKIGGVLSTGSLPPPTSLAHPKNAAAFSGPDAGKRTTSLSLDQLPKPRSPRIGLIAGIVVAAVSIGALGFVLAREPEPEIVKAQEIVAPPVLAPVAPKQEAPDAAVVRPVDSGLTIVSPSREPERSKPRVAHSKPVRPRPPRQRPPKKTAPEKPPPVLPAEQPKPAVQRTSLRRGPLHFEITRKLGKAAEGKATVSVAVKVGGKSTPTKVLIDGNIKTTPALFKVAPGTHRIRPKFEGERQRYVDLEVGPGEAINVLINNPGS